MYACVWCKNEHFSISRKLEDIQGLTSERQARRSEWLTDSLGWIDTEQRKITPCLWIISPCNNIYIIYMQMRTKDRTLRCTKLWENNYEVHKEFWRTNYNDAMLKLNLGCQSGTKGCVVSWSCDQQCERIKQWEYRGVGCVTTNQKIVCHPGQSDFDGKHFFLWKNILLSRFLMVGVHSRSLAHCVIPC